MTYKPDTLAEKYQEQRPCDPLWFSDAFAREKSLHDGSECFTMARPDPDELSPMSEPVTPRPLSSEGDSQPTAGLPDPSSPTASTPALQGPKGLHPILGIGIYLATGIALAWILFWLGKSFFPEPVHGAKAMWQDLYGEAAVALGACLPAFLMARIEHRSVDDYGLPRKQAFGKLFWVGGLWGLAAITILLLTMRTAHVFYFGYVTLHGMRVVKFAAFWGIFFLLVGIFEDFLFRGYLLFATARWVGFWPAAAVLSCAFGAIHLPNPGEDPIGALGAAAIGFFFCLTLRRTGTLWFAVGFHAAWDWGETYLYAVPNSGTIQPGHLLGSSFVGKEWLTGGAVGPEGSVFCFVLLILLWVMFDRIYPTAKYTVSSPAGTRAPETFPLSILE